MNEQNKNNIKFYSIISSIQKIALYETKSHFYLIGSNNTLTNFRVLKIDRMEPKILNVIDDQVQYTQNAIRDLVNRIDSGNRNQRCTSSGITKVVSAFGIIGFIRFLEGYYIILVTKRRKVAVIGHHTVYKIEDTSMIYIPSDSVRLFHPDEQRYVKLFQSIDLNSNFYFSYSYDLTHNLQSNMTLPNYSKSELPIFNSNIEINEHFRKTNSFNEKQILFQNLMKNMNLKSDNYGIRYAPNRRFVWNSHLLSSVEKILHYDWILYIIHGFIGQSNISVFGRSVYVTVIARRSNQYAGTRFLKRGANFKGDVANEVETEQLVYDSGVSSFNKGHYSSFVQMRGSVPGYWSQDVSKMVPKPSITIDLSDPFVEAAGAHFNTLLKRYGSPVVILNLVKKREKKKHESILSEEMNGVVKYLNQFLPPEHLIHHVSFDMARKNKGKEANVMERLANIANNSVLKTGIFLSLHSFHSLRLWNIDENNLGHYYSYSVNNKIKPYFLKRGSVQTGVIRTNCVDCLDRTNTAQFVIGKCALGYQLYALGILNTPKLEFDTDCVRMLEELYEDHGDTLALQYGGSQLVHRIKTYRKTAPWTSQGNDIMQTLSRYYSNTFSDQEKQHTINLFLGLFIPHETKPPIWEFLTDYYFHHAQTCKYLRKSKMLTQWWDENILKYLPYALLENTKTLAALEHVQNTQEEITDIYYDYYRPYELSLLSEIYAYQMSHSVRDFMPHFTTNFSPFAIRGRPGKRREEAGNKNMSIKNPSLTGQSSTSSAASSASSSVSSTEDEESQSATNYQIIMSKNSMEVSFDTLFPSMKKIYGKQPICPKRSDLFTYKKFSLISKSSKYELDHLNIFSKLFNSSIFMNLELENFDARMIENDDSFYRQYIKKEKVGGSIPNSRDMISYERYAHQQLLHLGVCNPDLI